MAAPGMPGAYPPIPDIEQAQFCSFTEHGMMAQSVVTMAGDFDLGRYSPRSARYLMTFFCSFDKGRCRYSLFWIDQISREGHYEKAYMAMPTMDEPEPSMERGHLSVNIKTAEETWAIDAVTHRVTYTKKYGDLRGEGQCVDRVPPGFFGQIVHGSGG